MTEKHEIFYSLILHNKKYELSCFNCEAQVILGMKMTLSLTQEKQNKNQKTKSQEKCHMAM